MKRRERILLLLEIAGERGATSIEIHRATNNWGTIGGLHVDLARLERDASVQSRFDDGPYPRKRRYWLKYLKAGEVFHPPPQY